MSSHNGQGSGKKGSLGLSIYSWLVVLCTLCLIFLGGMVTSKDAGLAVPDWPLSYGMINPPGWWEIETIRLEHGHRLLGAFVGLLVIGLMIWLLVGQNRRWLKVLGVVALVGVCFQGLLGGLRVTQLSTELAILHACTAQAYLCLLLVIAAAVTPGWMDRRAASGTEVSEGAYRHIFRWTLILGSAVYVQLILGAIMRHFRAGLVIPDFPLSFNQLIPPLNDSAVALNFSHRAGALVVAILTITFLVVVLRHGRRDRSLAGAASLLIGLVAMQIALGAYVVWWERSPGITTFHVLNGAAILGTTVLMAVRSAALSRLTRKAGVEAGDLQEVPA